MDFVCCADKDEDGILAADLHLSLCHSERSEESKILTSQTSKLQQPPLHFDLPSGCETSHTTPKHNPILNS